MKTLGGLYIPHDAHSTQKLIPIPCLIISRALFDLFDSEEKEELLGKTCQDY